MEAAGCQQLLGGRCDYRGYGLRELLRASREETMPIDRWGFAPVVGKGLCNAVAFISRRPHPDRTPKLKTNWQPLFRSTVKVTKASRSEFAFGPVPPATFVARLAVGAAVKRLLWLLTGFERR